MDKNIPASGGELPAVQLTFATNPLADKEETEGDKDLIEGVRAPAAASVAASTEQVVEGAPIVSTATPPISNQVPVSHEGSRNLSREGSLSAAGRNHNAPREGSREGSRSASPTVHFQREDQEDTGGGGGAGSS